MSVNRGEIIGKIIRDSKLFTSMDEIDGITEEEISNHLMINDVTLNMFIKLYSGNYDFTNEELINIIKTLSFWIHVN